MLSQRSPKVLVLFSADSCFAKYWMQKTSNPISQDRLYCIRKGMIQRCYYSKHRAYKTYGGAGITICDEWLSDYPAFKEWAHSNGYESDLTIDRIDGTKGYSPENCRWVSRAAQMRNLKRNTCSDEIAAAIRARYAVGGVTMRTLAAEHRIGLTAVHGCIHNTKWPPIAR